MKRMTRIAEGRAELAEGCRIEDALGRLSQYESLHRSLEQQLADTLTRLDALRAQGRTGSATYRQLLAQKLTLKDLLARIALYVDCEDGD